MSESMIYGQMADLLAMGWSIVALLLLGFVLVEACYLLCVCILFSKTQESPRAGSGLK